MAEEKMIRLGQASRKLNVGHNTILEFLSKKGFSVENNPNTKLTPEQYAMLAKEYASSASEKLEASGLTIGTKHVENVTIEREKEQAKKRVEDEESIMIKNLGSKDLKGKDDGKPEKVEREKPKLEGIKVLGKIELEKKPAPPATEVAPKKEEEPVKVKEEPKPVELPEVVAVTPPPAPPVEEKIVETKAPEPPVVKEEKEPTPPVVVAEKQPDELIKAKADRLKGLKVVDKIELPTERKKEAPSTQSNADAKDDRKAKRPRKRITPVGEQQPGQQQQQHQHQRGGGQRPNQQHNQNRNKGHQPPQRVQKEEPSEKEIQDQIRATLAKLSGGGKKTAGSKYRREKRQALSEAQEQQMLQEQESSKTLKVTEFISANDLASLMNVSVNEVISTCLSLGMFVSINQRLDAEAITVIADEFGYDVQFTSADDELDVVVETDSEEELSPRAPIVTIMGHVDHGKTSLLDYIRNTKVTAQEAGGITQHIGAYDVTTKSGNKIAFLDTPGHEAFTAMRARGAKITDVAIIVVAADDDVMPQTKEAINHAQVAGVPIVIAINKIDKPTANPDKIREALSKINILVEEWGGKYQCQEISAKSGKGVDELLEKVLLEAELLNLKANPDRPATGSIIEASLDKGRGYVATVMIQNGTLKIGDIMLAGPHYGRVKAMFDDTGKRVNEAGPSTPVVVLGLDGAPQAGEKFNVMETDREARELASKRGQLLREQNMRTKKHITLDEIGRRLAIGNFKQLNVIVKGDVDGSVEALSDSLLKLSTPEIQVAIIHRGVGQISESDVLLASASDAIVLGFQVRPSAAAKRIAENEEIEIRLYSIIYDAINEVKDAMEGMLAPEVEEVIVGNAEIREVFKISKIGTIAGCMVTDGLIKRSNPIRLIRDGIVVYAGKLHSLKRFKDDASEVRSGFDCGIGIDGFNDMKVGDVIESYENREVKRTL
ncbi:translation initiation factor IF-2 [Chryseosolibacter indicus]|uniref:Translation initiation factor IF-2 n=1 Tax=Chryseosolibacter indicus TaxID=2782351 RepID=A0ABS5VX81_9BACT|nr:translation initiation factor IF-2 [Chryseosolibacter indicus]MBT1705457.1 translation initiation factor IF-2 [Chryseosolibacter indicus]